MPFTYGILHRHQRMAGLQNRLFFVDIDGGHSPTSRLQGGHQRAGFDEARAAGIHDDGRWFHNGEIGCSHDAAGCPHQAHV